MKITFAGTSEFSAEALETILDAGYNVPLVLTQPDRPAGRGMTLKASPVKQLALKHGLPVYQPSSLKPIESWGPIAEAGADVMVVAAYGLILPQLVLDLPRLGCLNIHASLLPRWRGAAPIQRALLAGDSETGVTIMQMDAGLDTGSMLCCESLPITQDDTAQTLHDNLATLGADLLLKTLVQLEQGHLTAIPQPAEGVTYAAKFTKQDTELDWRQPAETLERKVRAFNPMPGAVTYYGETAIKIGAARLEPMLHGAPGQILKVSDEGIVVACGTGALRITECQKAGGKRLPVLAFLRGFSLKLGTMMMVSRENNNA